MWAEQTKGSGNGGSAADNLLTGGALAPIIQAVVAPETKGAEQDGRRQHIQHTEGDHGEAHGREREVHRAGRERGQPAGSHCERCVTMYCITSYIF